MRGVCEAAGAKAQDSGTVIAVLKDIRTGGEDLPATLGIKRG